MGRPTRESQGRPGKKTEKSAPLVERSNLLSMSFGCYLLVLATIVSGLHYWHLSTLFENDRHFSHLADFEREMAYRTEMGLYFSYYKTLIRAPSFLQGLYDIIHDDVTEYGHTINTLKRFNLYPEVVLAAFFRVYKYISGVLEWRNEWCWQINRGSHLPPVESCIGSGNSHIFYVNGAFLVAGSVAGSLFLLGSIVSGSSLGGLLSIACFAFNHGEATRAQWTPPLRETFGYPFILLQMTTVVIILRQGSGASRGWSAASVLAATAAMLCWQFSQFVFFTQLAVLFGVFLLDSVALTIYRRLVLCHLASLALSFLLLFGNEMLLTSLYFPVIIASLVTVTLTPFTPRIWFRPLFLLVSLLVFGGVVIAAKCGLSAILQIEDDAHIFDILRSKFTDFANFHTRLYTCSAEFGFIQMEMVEKLTKTLLLPAGGVAVILSALAVWRGRGGGIWTRKGPEECADGHLLYQIGQTSAFFLLAVLIMRLKLLFTPHLCATTALVASPKVLGAMGMSWEKIRWPLVAALLAVMAFHGRVNLEQQWSIRGEYSNPDQEMLFDWIQTKTDSKAVFAGTMPVMANVKLSTERPIANHPHYEDAGIRNRTLKVYSIFSKKRLEEVHRTYLEMGVNYVVIQLMNCRGHHKPECTYRSMWDLQDPENRGRSSLCDLWEEAAQHPLSKASQLIRPFSMVYNQASYTVLKV